MKIVLNPKILVRHFQNAILSPKCSSRPDLTVVYGRQRMRAYEIYSRSKIFRTVELVKTDGKELSIAQQTSAISAYSHAIICMQAV